MSNLSTLKQKVEEMQAEIERLDAEEREPEIPVGTLCWLWDDVNGKDPELNILDMIRRNKESRYIYGGTTENWKHARIANDIPGVMVWEKHDGGPCPVDGECTVFAIYNGDPSLASSVIGSARGRTWGRITAYAIINKAEWME